jgi:hypothetical protein
MRGTAPSIRNRPRHIPSKILGHSPDCWLQRRRGLGSIHSPFTPVPLDPDPMLVTFDPNGHDTCTAMGPMTTVCNQ